MKHVEFLNKYKNILAQYWKSIKPHILDWKNLYEWPKGTKLEESLAKRNKLEAAIKNEIKGKGYLSKKVFDDVMVWGFGRPSNNNEEEIQQATQKAFHYLRQDKLKEAALELVKLPGVGISRASKVLALYDQYNLGIYDSRAADGLSDLIVDGRRFMPIPPGRVVVGDTNLSQDDFCSAFEKYVWVLRSLMDCAKDDVNIGRHFTKASDIEIALFARSRLKGSKDSRTVADKEIIEGDKYWTLGYGNRAKPFWASIDENGIIVFTGPEGKTALYLKHKVVEQCLEHFRGRGWFPMGNNVTSITPGGLGEYFREKLLKSPKFASHFAAMLVDQNRLEYRYGKRNMVELRVV